MFAYVFYTGMKDHNCLKDASLSFVTISLRKALKKPHALKALLRNGSPSQDCLFCLDPLYVLPELRWALAPTKNVYQCQLPLCTPSTCRLF